MRIKSDKVPPTTAPTRPAAGLGVVLVAHAPLTSALLEVACHILAQRQPDLLTIDVAADSDRAALTRDVLLWVERQGFAAVLLLADMAGGSPFFIADGVLRVLRSRARLVTGLNLPMLLKVLTIRQNIHDIDRIAMQGARAGRLGVRLVDPAFPVAVAY